MPRKEYYYSADERALRAANRRLRLAQAAKNPDVVIYGERIVKRVTATATCEMTGCGKEFSFVMTTKAHRFCPECKAAREKQRSDLRVRTYTTKEKSPRQVRYAGYDASERELDGDTDNA